MRRTDPEDPFAYAHVTDGSVAQFLPIVDPAACNRVVNRRERPLGVGQVPVLHAPRLYRPCPDERGGVARWNARNVTSAPTVHRPVKSAFSRA